MTCRELGEKTLITKGTLTGVLDRMEARGLIRRGPSDADRRQVFVSLTAADMLFEELNQPSDELDQARELLQRLRDALRDAHSAMRVT